MKFIKNFIINFFFISLSILSGLIVCELALRIKHAIVPNYDIEMWKYAKQLKQKDLNPKIGHVHIKNKSALLQKVEIKINNHGQRDIYLDNDILKKYEKRFLILGSSIALGWGVSKKKTFSNTLNKISKSNDKNWIFINGGIGNYNTERYVNNYLKNWQQLDFTDIVVQFFVNDTELINPNKTNIFTQNTHLGVVIWRLYNSYKASLKKESIIDYYKEKYDDSYLGFQIAKKELNNLKRHCDLKKINCTIVLMPDIHKLTPYNLFFINEKISLLSKELDIRYFDLLPALKNIEQAKLWNKYQDPHPNSYGHEIIAKEMYTFLSK
jgi:hypothetical protein